MNIKNATPQSALLCAKAAILTAPEVSCGVAFLSCGDVRGTPFGSHDSLIEIFFFSNQICYGKRLKAFPTGFGAELPEESWLPKGGKLPVCKATDFKTELGRRGNPSLHPPLWVEIKKKESSMTRSKSKLMNFRVTQEDYGRIHRRAEKAGLSLSGYLLTAAMQREIIVIEGLKEAAKELRKIGTNINQLTRLCNEGRITCLELKGVKAQLEEIWRFLNSLTRKAV
jgi:hypothetical protein